MVLMGHFYRRDLYAENSNQMNPCLTCSDLKNIEEYMKYANANKK